MKKWPVLLVLALLLAGCEEQPQTTQPADTLPPGVSTTVRPVVDGLYAPGSSLENYTGGAVKLYPLGKRGCDGIVPMGQALLLLEKGEVTGLTLLRGEELTEEAHSKLTFSVSADSGALQVSGKGIAYHDEQDGSLVFLNGKLSQISRMKLPEDILGKALLSPEQDRAYYCTADGVQVLDLATGISRQLAQQSSVRQTVSGILLDGEVLRCDMQRQDGKTVTRILSTATGQTLWEGSLVEQMTTRGKSWLLKFDRGSVTEWVFGARGEGSRNLWPGEGVAQCALLDDGNIVAVTSADWGTRLDLYDTAAGRRISSVILPGIYSVCDIYSDGGIGIWLRGQETAHDREVILHWEPGKTTCADSTVYTAPHYPADAPDMAGTAQMNAAAAVLEEAYGVDILLGGDATAVTLGGYGFETEHLVQAMEKYLPRLQKILSVFPEGFFQTAGEKTASGRVRICLVRSIRGSAEYGTLPKMPCVQFWSGGEAYLMVTMDDRLEQSFLHAMMQLIETRVLSVCTAYYDWDKLNPPGFQYDNDYIKNLKRDEPLLITGDSRVFVDYFSMSFSREDRARIFTTACLPGNAEVFSSEIMKDKLTVLCEGIRQAFDLVDGEYIWEQYLSQKKPAK